MNLSRSGTSEVLACVLNAPEHVKCQRTHLHLQQREESGSFSVRSERASIR